MEKKKYEQPTMLIYELKTESTFLLTSGTRDPYEPVPWPGE